MGYIRENQNFLLLAVVLVIGSFATIFSVNSIIGFSLSKSNNLVGHGTATLNSVPSQELTNKKAMESQLRSQGLSVELDIPPYYPEFLRHPQKFFSGRTLLITNDDPVSKHSAALKLEKGGSSLYIQSKKKKDRSITLTIPGDTPTGHHRLSLLINGKLKEFFIDVKGLTDAEKKSARTSAAASSVPEISFRTKICDVDSGYLCYWEMVFSGNPNDPKKLFHFGGLLSRSLDGGRTWKTEDIETITDYPIPKPGMQFRGDPKLVAFADGSLLLSGVSTVLQMDSTLKSGGVLLRGRESGRLTASIFQDIPVELPIDRVLDRPNLAISADASSIFISGNRVWFEDTKDFTDNALYVSKDGGKTFVRERVGYNASGSIHSMTTGSDGTLYTAASIGPTVPGLLLRVRWFDKLISDTFSLPGVSDYAVAKISTTNNRGWFPYAGPEIVGDISPTSQHSGRIYAIWSQQEKLISDPDSEYSFYGYNFDVFVIYSDNRGETWSAPVRVNDDIGKGDQIFPSARVDSNGILHVAFVDHRDNQDKAVFDIYYAYSKDGGNTFSKNIKVTDVPTSNNLQASRPIGDYLDMVMGYPDRAYVAYPCGQSDFGPTGACMVEINIKPVSPLPDLAIIQTTVSKKLIGFSYSIVVSNIGTTESGVWEFQIKNRIGSTKTATYTSLKPKESRLITGRILNLPIIFIVDPKNLIKELSKANNNLTITSPTSATVPPNIEQEVGPSEV